MGKTKKAQPVVEKCQVLRFRGRVRNNQKVEHPQTDANLHQNLLQRHTAELWKEQLLFPAQLIFLECKLHTSQACFIQRRKYNPYYPWHIYRGAYAFSLSQIIAVDPRFRPIKQGWWKAFPSLHR